MESLENSLLKLQALGLRIVKYNEWAIMFQDSNGIYGYIDIEAKKNNIFKNEHIENIYLTDYFAVCRFRIFNGKLINSFGVSIRGNTHNILSRIKRLNIINLEECTYRNAKVLLIENLSKTSSTNKYSLVSYTGKRWMIPIHLAHMDIKKKDDGNYKIYSDLMKCSFEEEAAYQEKSNVDNNLLVAIVTPELKVKYLVK